MVADLILCGANKVHAWVVSIYTIRFFSFKGAFIGPLSNEYGCTLARRMEVVFREEIEGY